MGKWAAIAVFVAIVGVFVYYFAQYVSGDIHLHGNSFNSNIEHVVNFMKDSNNIKRIHPFNVELEILEQRDLAKTDNLNKPEFYEKVRVVEEIKWFGLIESYYVKTVYRLSTEKILMTIVVENTFLDVTLNYTFTRTGEHSTNIDESTLISTLRILLPFTLKEATFAHQEILRKSKEIIENESTQKTTI